MRARRVFREMPSSAAVREMFQPVSASTSMTRSRTASSSELGGPPLRVAVSAALRRSDWVQPERLAVTAGSDESSANTLHQIGELANVARPRVCGERRLRVGGQRLRRQRRSRRRPGRDVLGQHQDVAAARAQRRQSKREYGEAVIESSRKRRPWNGRPQILVGRGQDPDVDRLVARAAQAGAPSAPRAH